MMRVLPALRDSSRFQLLWPGLTLVDTVHIERPPGNGSVSIEPSTVKIFDLDDFAPKMSHEVDGLLPSVGNPTVGCVEFFEGAEAHYDGSPHGQ